VIALYLAALVVALGVVGVQLLGGADGHDVAGHDISADAGGGDGAHGEHEGAAAASLFLSTRFWTFALLALGMVGSLLSLLKLASPWAIVVLAVTSGLVSGLFAALVFRALRRSDKWSGASLQEAVGTTARVLVPCAKGRVGKVRALVKGATVDILAMTDADEIETGAHVLISAIDGGIAKVERAPKELEP
jgi:membrane protein implicated in regulation of membrane protease activity